MKTALREEALGAIKAIGSVDILVGIPSFHCEETIGFVIGCVAHGLAKYYPDKKAAILVADGGSTDDTREEAHKAETNGIDKVVAIYRGIAGKGSAFRMIFEAADRLGATAIAIFESDHKSIVPEWVRNTLAPIVCGEFDFVAPAYKRYKFDATITTTIAYNLTRALYGAKLRQPIGGDWGVSLPFARFLIAQDIWESDVAKYGIDIWMTTRALVCNFRVCEARLGAKRRRAKDPNDLSAMFYQVVGTLFSIMQSDLEFWANIKGVRELPCFGEYVGLEPEAFAIDKSALIEYYKGGFANFGALWREFLDDEAFAVLERLAAHKEGERFDLPIAVWVRIVYRYATRYRKLDRQRNKLLSALIPIYNARVASQIDALSDDTIAAEAYFEAQANAFEAQKPSLIAQYRS
ncbi:glycosyl transferase [Campylobacterota bacterium]|nr:glycosyl transferase [Campylobacterota bacterium]